MERKKMKENRKRRIHPFFRGFLGCLIVAAIIGIGAAFAAAGSLHEKLNYQEIGEILKIKPETAKMRYYRARLKLQDELKNIFALN